MANFFGRVVKNALFLSWGTFWLKKLFLPKKFYFFNDFVFWALEINRVLGDFAPNWLLELCFKYSGDHCNEKHIFIPFFGQWAKNVQPFGQFTFDRVVKTVFYVFNGTFWAINCFFPKKTFLDNQRETIGLLAEGFLQGCSTCPEEHLEEKQFLGKNYNCSSFPGFGRKIFGLLVKVFWQWCQHCILRVQRNILKENNFLKENCNRSDQFQTLGVKFLAFQPGFQHCNLRVQKNFLKKNSFLKKDVIFLILLGIWA